MEDALTIVILGVVVYLLKLDTKQSILAMVAGITLNETTKSHTLKLNRVNDSRGMNESLILEAKLNGIETLFMLDTGYAGPAVLSSSYLVVQEHCRKGNVLKRYRDSIDRLRQGVKDDDRHRMIDQLIRHRECQSYTSGCTMTLAGIGSVVEQQADMLMCKPLMFKNTWGRFVAPSSPSKPKADVLVTNALPVSVNILTCDYLLHSSPALIKMKRQTLELFLSPLVVDLIRYTFVFVEARMMGGAFVIPIVLDGGETLKVTMDTGAPGPICMNKNAISKLKTCRRPQPKKVTQKGVNGEQICSDVLFVSASLAGIHLDEVGIFVNDMNAEGVDGYVGLGVLRALDILITPSQIGFRKSGLHPLQSFAGAVDGMCSAAYACQTSS
tara:strand:+ start:660 stop:1811 length:1152 start_codon:yes stop_codon:yes gene_type:complete